MRTFILLSLAAVLSCALPAVTFAREVDITDTTCDYDCLKKKCADAGGTFSGNHADYTCNNPKKGTEVTCQGTSTWHQCHGYVPIKAGGGKGSITSVLHGGVTVKPVSGGKGNVNSNKPVRHPVRIGVKNPRVGSGVRPVVNSNHNTTGHHH